MNVTDAAKLARARIEPRWRAAFREPRWGYRMSGGTTMPFTIEQSAAIESGATTVALGHALTAAVNPQRTHVDVDGNVYMLEKVVANPEILTISDDHDSSHMDLRTILSELQVLTGIRTTRWMIEVDTAGTIEVHVAPSDAFVAPEIRNRALADYASLAQWVIKYNVKATVEQLTAVFGPTGGMLGPEVTAAGSDDSVLKPFMDPMNVIVHQKGARHHRRINVLGTTSVRDVIRAAGCPLFLHGVPLLPFKDVAIWRCCHYNNTVLHLYDHAHPVEKITIQTMGGPAEVPRRRAAKAFVPYPTLSGNLFGDRAVCRPTDVAAAAPQQLTREWLIMLNASSDFVCYDHGALLLEVLTPRYGRQPVLDVLRTMMTPEQYGVLFKIKASPTCIRRRYIVYVRCVMDLIQGTQTSPTVDVVMQGRTFAVPPTMRWSQLVQAMPKGTKLGLASDTQQAMVNAGQDFLLEELRAGTIKLTVG